MNDDRGLVWRKEEEGEGEEVEDEEEIWNGRLGVVGEEEKREIIIFLK